MNRIRRGILVPAALAVFAVCQTAVAKPRTTGLEDLVTCRLNSHAAELAFTGFLSGIRSGAIRTSKEREGFYRPSEITTVFGVEVEDMMFGGMHGTGGFMVRVRGDVDMMRARIKEKLGLQYNKSKIAASGTHRRAFYVDDVIRFKDGIALGPLTSVEEVKAIPSLLDFDGDKTGLIIVGCSLIFMDSIRDPLR